MVICLERGADLHMSQRMPLPLTVSCFSKIQTGFSFLVPAHPGSNNNTITILWSCPGGCLLHLSRFNSVFIRLLASISMIYGDFFSS